MSDVTKVHFRDIDQRERAERKGLTDRVDQLHQKKNLSRDEKDERDRLTAIIKRLAAAPHELCDPLFVGVRHLFNDRPGILNAELENHVRGMLRFGPPKKFDDNGAASTPGRRSQPKPLTAAGALIEDAVVRAALTLGLLMDKETHAPPVMLDANNRIVSMTSAPESGELSRDFYGAIGNEEAMHELAMLVLPILAQEGDANGPDRKPGSSVDAREFARVMLALNERGVTPDEPQLRRRVNERLDRIQSVGEDRPITELGIDLPDLEQESKDIVPNNVRLMGPMICSAMFDELKAFQVVDKLVELFQHGMLPIGSGEAGKLLYKYWKDAPNRMSEGERKNFYAMTMGIPGGETSGMVNRDFNDLWLRFVSSVSSFIRQNDVDKLLRASLPSAISQQQVRKAARDLAANLSLHGYGMAYYAALDLQDQIRFMIRLLSDSDIRSAYGARDMWQVVDQVATLELGGAKTSSRYRTLATCGAIITAWLADNVERIMRPTGAIIDIDDVRSPLPRSSGQKATTHPSDYDLVNACELWLADTATSDTRIDEMSQPREAPAMTSKPVQIPSILRDARDMVEGVGLGMGLGFPNSRH